MLANVSFPLPIDLVLRTAKWITALSLFFFLLTTSLFSQQSGTMTNVDSQTLQSLLDRIASLEASDKQLRERVAQLEGAQAGATKQTVGSTATQVGDSAGPAAASTASAAPKSDPARAERPQERQPQRRRSARGRCRQ